jgi:hemerythrin
MGVPNLTPMDWKESYLMGFAAMDATHQEFVACVAALQTATDDALAASLAAFEAHAVQHFAEEQQWMESSAFPATECHVDEHMKVLASVREVQEILRVTPERRQVARDLAQALVDWFPGHADYMDASLSHWMSQRAHGGAPVVLRRNMAQNDTTDIANNTHTKGVAA